MSASILVASVAATAVFALLLSVARLSGATRLSVPLLLGTFFTQGRDRAKVLGALTLVACGLGAGLLHAQAFVLWGAAGALRGLALGLGQGVLVVTIGLELLPSLHPRMASEQHGPSAARVLEPPGRLGRHWGAGTALALLAAHAAAGAVFGAILEELAARQLMPL